MLLEKAEKALLTKSVKLHVFKPSNIEIWTVVGREGDELVNDEENYCSCKHFFFNERTCYHLLALRMAKEKGIYDYIEFNDLELKSFIKALLEDMNIKALKAKRY